MVQENRHDGIRWLLPMCALALALGILLGRMSELMWLGLAALLCAIGAVVLLHGRARSAAVLAAVCAAGFVCGSAAYHPAMPAEGEYTVRGVVASEVRMGERGQVKATLCDVTLNGVPAGRAYWSGYPGAFPEGLTPGCVVTMTAEVYAPSGADNPGGFDFREYLLQQGITYGLYGAEGLNAAPADFFSLQGWLASVRHEIRNRLVTAMGEESGSYAATMLLGLRSLIPSEDRATFNQLGIAHILSVSGFHVGVLAGICLWLMKLLRVRGWGRVAVLTALLGAYCLLTGGSAPVVRASILMVLGEMGSLRGRVRSGLHLLSASFIVTLLLNPTMLTGASFQLTYGAMLGLVLVTPFLSKCVPVRTRLGAKLLRGVWATLGAQIGLLLPMLYWFQELPLLSVVLNVLVMPLLTLLLTLDWVVLFLLPLMPAAHLVGQGASWLMGLVLQGVRMLGAFDWVSAWMKQANGLTALGWLLLMTGLCFLLGKGRKRFRLGLVSLGGVLLAFSMVVLPSTGTTYVQLSVGNADAAVLQDKNMVIAVDTGEDGEALATYLHQRHLPVDVLILTHLHTDHAGGIDALLDNHIPVGVCYMPWGADAALVDRGMTDLVEQLRASGTEMRMWHAGDTLDLPSGELRVVWPEEGKVHPNQDANESSLVCRVALNGTSMLLTGDLDGRYERYAALPADILKAAHHGSKSSNGEAFLSAVSAEAVLVSCGDDARMLSMEERCGDTPVYATRNRGAVTVDFSEDGTFTVKTMK